MLVVVEPYFRSLETGARALALASQLGVPRIFTVANKVRTDDERRAVLDFCARHEMDVIAHIPYDEKLPEADRLGISPLDLAPDSPAVVAIRQLAGELERRAGPRHNGH